VVREPDYWVATGTFLKNGLAAGEVTFDGPVVADTHGPNLVLELTNRDEVFLHTLVPDL
jgi:hypothetical protein